ncbi:hypothetical protein LF817_11210 [Halobacillus sp. A1]|uniref:hypothetical protein n=1 Tax=Halobacillus sp. A1 TaxID=2880262 RepID=UPI0020A6839E|nr:hypothetical protein [Halobacillus sp. A1]MCP3031913.1 hypothetical protein [Halobacillus sp. A1]
MFGDGDSDSMNYIVVHLISLSTCTVVAGMIVAAALREFKLPTAVSGFIASLLSLVVAYLYYQTFL